MSVKPEVMVIMTLKRQWTISLIGYLGLIVATLLPSPADACHGRMMHGQMQGEAESDSAHYLKHLLKHAEEIGLTSEQIGQIKALQLDFKRAEARTEADIKIAKLELNAMLDDEQADLTAIKTKVTQLKQAEGVLMVVAIKTKRDGMALLTTEQREKDRALHEQMKRKGEAKQGGGMGGMGCGGMGSGGGHGRGQAGGRQSEMGGVMGDMEGGALGDSGPSRSNDDHDHGAFNEEPQHQ